MRWRAIALISAGINVLLAGMWLFSARHSPMSPPVASTGAGPVPSAIKTNFVVRRQFFSWREVESPDYPTYIANLIDIGCPEQTIRDIIIADVNSLYARKRATDPEIVAPEQQWWRSEPDTNALEVAVRKLRSLDEERRTLLARLLGPSWESGDMISLPRPSRRGIALSGPILGALPAETQQAIQLLNARSQERLQAYMERMEREGKSADPVELAKLRQRTREELAGVLSPQQLEEFLLRYSQGANNLRAELGQLRFFNATPEEFRAMFRASDPLDQRIELIEGNDPNTVLGRKALEDQRENAIRIALGPKRYEEYRNLHDPFYREAYATALEGGAPDSARTIYQINQAVASQHDDILANTNLTAEQKNIELKRLELEQLQANTLAMGQDLPPEPPVPTPPAPKRTYTLQPGDNVAVVSIIFGVPVSAIRAANPGVDLRRLKPGDSLDIPRNPLGPPPGR
jgi:LysM repeat protein